MWLSAFGRHAQMRPLATSELRPAFPIFASSKGVALFEVETMGSSTSTGLRLGKEGISPDCSHAVESSMQGILGLCSPGELLTSLSSASRISVR